MTAWTIPCLLAVALAVLRPRTYPVLQALAGLTPAGAALVVGGASVPTFYFVAMAAPVVLLLDALRADHEPRRMPVSTPGVRPLVGLLVWAVVATAVAPVLFPGTQVWSSAFDSTTLEPGSLDQSSIAQVVYLALSVCVVVAFARMAPQDLRPLWIIAGGVVALALWRLSSVNLGVPFPAGLFDNNTSYRFIEGLPGGGTRFRGTLSEPASLATIALGSVALFAFSAGRTRGAPRFAFTVAAGVSLWMGLASGAATFILSASVFAGLLVAFFAVRWIAGRPESTGVLASMHALLIVGVLASGALISAVAAVVEDKVASDSYTERSGLDGLALQILLRTDGLGAGLGTHRPSSLVAALASNLGVPGLLLFVAVFATVLWSARQSTDALPSVALLVALLTAKIISGPDLNDTSGLLWIGLGVAAGAGRIRRRCPAHPLAPPAAPVVPARVEVAT